MSVYVLIPGAWLGAWAWDQVVENLESSGGRALPVSLPGLAERAAEASPVTNLETYVRDVIDLIVGQDLDEVTLVGHSFGGAVAAGVADRVPERLSSVVYVDAGPPPSGSSFMDLFEDPQREFVTRIIEERGGGMMVPVPTREEFGSDFPASLEGIGEAGLDQMMAMATPQPVKTWTEPLTRTMSQKAREVPKTLIATSMPLTVVEQLIATGHPWFAELAGPEWSFEELLTGHWPMFSRPAELAELLMRVPAKTG